MLPVMSVAASIITVHNVLGKDLETEPSAFIIISDENSEVRLTTEEFADVVDAVFTAFGPEEDEQPIEQVEPATARRLTVRPSHAVDLD